MGQNRKRHTAATLQADSVIGIVNRGEPALRLIRAVREYNLVENTSLRTAAFYLDEEADALFVREADIAVAFHAVPGARQEGQVYLNHEVLLEALSRAECDAVWAGWGFVSEDADFVRRVEEAGIAFLGPGSGAMAQLGDKITAKEVAEKAGVPILPWSKRPVRDSDDAARLSEEIGYPVIVKAANAGGGRGIRFVQTPEDLESQYASAREETRRVTGDDIVFIERLVTTGRHLEVQCLGDRHGNVFTFGVRDCSIQRRNQKIIEETPPAGLGNDVIAGMEESARRLLEEAGYESAGTVEFLYDLDRNEFYFMEVNTRLQVEHPITEILYDVDLVKGQIQVAFDKELTLGDRTPRGWVVEARLNAEDPDSDFAPAPGVVRRFRVPLGPGLRVDSGIGQGSVIPAIFDSMVGKIIASGSTRGEALGRLRRALNETRVAIDGGTTNKAFLLELLSQKEVQNGPVHTKYVEAMLERGGRVGRDDPGVALLAAAIDAYGRHERAELDIFRRQISNLGHPRRSMTSGGHEVAFGYEGRLYRFVVRRVSPTLYEVEKEDGSSTAAFYVHNDDESRLEIAGNRYSIQTIQRGDLLQCEVNGVPYALQLGSGGTVKAPSPAVVLSIGVQEGESVAAGQRLLSLEAMKMEMLVEAPSDGVVQEIAVKPGQQVTVGDTLVQIDAVSSGDDERQSAEPGSPTVEFPVERDDPLAIWERRAEAFAAMFLGYDHPIEPPGLLDLLVESAGEHGFGDRLFDLFYRVLEAHVRIDSLFASERIEVEHFARPVSWQELVFVYFQYDMAGSETLPEQFTGALHSALSYYPSGGSEEGAWNAFFHMYRAQRVAAHKETTLRSLLFTLERLPIPSNRSQGLLRILDDLIRLSLSTGSVVTDAALHARYELYDRISVMSLRNRRRDRFQEQLRLLQDLDAGDPSREEIRQRIVDTSGYADYELLHAYHGADASWRAGITEIVARRAVRDRSLPDVASLDYDGHPATLATADGISTLVALCTYPEDATPECVEGLLGRLGATDSPPEVLLLVSGEEEDQAVFTRFANHPLPVKWISIGIYRDARAFTYRTFRLSGDSWSEDTGRRGFSPLFYRELRVGRLAEFDTEVVYHTDTVYLVQATARSNKRDQRLIAYGSASESMPEIDDDGQIRRVDEFDEVFTEAVYKMRSLQARRTRRLLWNRIVIHVRALTPTTAVQIKEYGNRMIPLTSDLGLEKAIIYTRRKRWSESIVRELELLFLNISEDQFTLRSRKPSEEPLKPMDAYVASVVRSRQRGNIYPYEIIKSITFSGYPVSVNVPRGEFEEHDLEQPGGERPRAVSVKGRPFGQNESNVVFGIVRNQDTGSELFFRRVIILSDATRDMGSLAEPECRRILAAIDLAAEHDVPVEWIPISSGARIDMESGTENLDWTARVLRRIVEFTQDGGEINVVVTGINVGAQSYWNAEATMLMHTSGLLIMTDEASMLLTGKKALDFSGSVSGDTNTEIGGVEKIMGPNGQAQIRVSTLAEAYSVLFSHYRYTYRSGADRYPVRVPVDDPALRDIGEVSYQDRLGQGFHRIGDIFSAANNLERKKPFDMRQVMAAVVDSGIGFLERWAIMKDAETAIAWETRIGGYGAGLIGIESRPLGRVGDVPHDGPETWSGGTLFPGSSKKVARALNAWSGRVPVVVLANLSGFDGSPESLRKLQLEYGAEIGRAVVNFAGPIIFVVVARYHGGAYVVFSRALNENLRAYAIDGSFASVLGGAPAAAVVFPRQVEKMVRDDERIASAAARLESDDGYSQREFDDLYREVYAEKQKELGARFDSVHDIRRAKSVGSIDEIITIERLRPAVIDAIERGMRRSP